MSRMHVYPRSAVAFGDVAISYRSAVDAIDCSTCGALGLEFCIPGCEREEKRTTLINGLFVGGSPSAVERARVDAEKHETHGVNLSACTAWPVLAKRARERLAEFSATIASVEPDMLAILAELSIHSEVRELAAGELARRGTK